MIEKHNQSKTLPVNTNSITDIAYFTLIMLVWSKDVLLTYVRAIIMRVPFFGRYPDLILSTVWAVCILFAIPRIAKKINLSQAMFVITLVVVYFLNYIIYPVNSGMLSELLPQFMLYALPLYFVGASLDVNKYFKYFHLLSILSVLCMAFFKTVVNAPMDDMVSLYQGDMDSAYKILPHICIVIYGMITRANAVNVLTFAVGFVLMFSLGCRGALGCMIAFLLIMIIWFQKRRYRVLSYTFLITGSTLIVVYFYDIMLYLGHFAQNLGLSIRIFDKYFSGELFESSTRNVIKEKLFDLIFEEPFIGHGMGADRVLANVYAHNIFVELCLNFGVIIGSILIFAILFRIMKAYRLITVNSEKAFFITMVLAGFVHLFLSSSYISNSNFYLLLGLCAGYIAKPKTKFIPPSLNAKYLR